MEKQFNSDMEQMNPEETLTFMVGQLPSRVKPSLNVVYDDPTFALYMIDLGNGDLTVHADAKVKVTHNILKHYNEVFIAFVLGLMERGFTYVHTWIEMGNEQQENFAAYFGFELTPYIRTVTMDSGEEKVLQEMKFTFPELDKD